MPQPRAERRRACGAVAGLKPIVWVGIALAIFQQFVGINVVFYYLNVSVTIFAMAPVTDAGPETKGRELEDMTE